MLRGQFDRTRPDLTPSSLALNVTAVRNVRLGSRNKLLYWFNTEVHFITLSRFTRLKVTVTLTSRWVLAHDLHLSSTFSHPSFQTGANA